MTVYAVVYGENIDERVSQFYQEIISNEINGKYLELRNKLNTQKLLYALCLKISNEHSLFLQYKNEILSEFDVNHELHEIIMDLSGDVSFALPSFPSPRQHVISELKKVKKEGLKNIAVIPDENNIFRWHINIKPLQGVFSHQIIHLIMSFDEYSTCRLPEIRFISSIPNNIHPNIIDNCICIPHLLISSIIP